MRPRAARARAARARRRAASPVDMESDDLEPTPAEPAPAAEFVNRRITQSTTVDKNFTFRVDVILPGTTLLLPPESGRVRICSLLMGRVVVKVDGEEPFAIGFSGMFQLVPGVGAEVLNSVGINAVLQISSIRQSM